MAPDSAANAPPTGEDFHAAIGRGANVWYAACLRVTRDEALAQDAVQDALLSAWSKRAQFDGRARLETWIHRIAVNSALGLLRRRRPESWLDDEAMPGCEPTPLDASAEQELGRELEAALADLSELERVCFVLKHLEQWRLAEIAQMLDTSVGSVKQALFRSLNKLRASMAPRRMQT